MKEIIISNYDSAWNWTIVRKEKDKYYKFDSNTAYVDLYDSVERRIYDSQILMWNDEKLTKEKVIEELTKLGYEKITICDDGDIEIYINGNREV